MRVLDDIAAAWKANHPGVSVVERSPVVDRDLRSLWKLSGTVVPEVASMLAWRDGEVGESITLGDSWRLLPCEEIRERLGVLAHMPVSLSTECDELRIPEVWPAAWIPILDWNGAVLGVVDGRDPRNAPMYGVSPESGEVAKWSSSLGVFFEQALDEITATKRLSIDRLMGWGRQRRR
jgi:hypothetical protein